jgi:hypothetical protein
MNKATDVFADPHAVAKYAEGPPRLVPGFADLQRMAMLLLAESTPQDARVLVVGAGGGLELKVPILTPEQDEAILRESGFTNVSLFYVGFTFRGWVAYAEQR